MSFKVKWGYISAQKLETERSKSFALSISRQTKPSQVSLDSPTLENIAQFSGNRSKVCQNNDAGKAVSATL